MAAQKGSAARQAGAQARDLAENGREEYGWRLVDDRPELVVVAIGFSIPGLPHEEFEAFRARMLRFARKLGQLELPVLAFKLHRRATQGKQHWAEFDCETPGARLPVAGET